MFDYDRKPVQPIKMQALAIVAAIAAFPFAAQAHEDEAHCEAVEVSVSDASFGDVVTVVCNDGQALIASNTYPAHPMMTGIVGTMNKSLCLLKITSRPSPCNRSSDQSRIPATPHLVWP